MKHIKCSKYSKVVGYHVEYIFKTNQKNVKLELRCDQKDKGQTQFEEMLKVLGCKAIWN